MLFKQHLFDIDAFYQFLKETLIFIVWLPFLCFKYFCYLFCGEIEPVLCGVVIYFVDDAYGHKSSIVGFIQCGCSYVGSLVAFQTSIELSNDFFISVELNSRISSLNH